MRSHVDKTTKEGGTLIDTVMCDSRAVGGELPLFYEPRYAEFFVNYWRRIAAPFGGVG